MSSERSIYLGSQYGIHSRLMFDLYAVFLDAYIIGAIVDMNATVFCADPHC